MLRKNSTIIKKIGLVMLALASIEMAVAKTIFVRQGVKGNGTSWTNAYGDLQNALDAAVKGDQIWVAKGTYKPSVIVRGSGNRNRSFKLKNGVEIYGGFAGTESILAQRDVQSNTTILSGDLNGDDGPNFANTGDNCYHIFFHNDGYTVNASAVLDGFTITAGIADGPGFDAFGGGIHNYQSSPTVANCTFVANYSGNMGAGMYNSSNSNATVINCIFSGNASYYHGGGMSNAASSPTVINCIFRNNAAETYYGGGMVNNSSSPTVINSTFSGNTSKYYGGGMANFTSSYPTITNCILWNNSAATSGDEIYNASSTPAISYSNIQGCLSGNSWDKTLGTDGGGNMDENPNFDAYLQLKEGSPCIDAADGDAAVATDLMGNLRYDDPAMSNIGTGYPRYVDIGAYEFVLSAFEIVVGDFSRDGKVNLVDYSMLAAAWMSDDRDGTTWNPACDLDDSGRIDTGDLKIFMEHWLE